MTSKANAGLFNWYLNGSPARAPRFRASVQAQVKPKDVKNTNESNNRFIINNRDPMLSLDDELKFVRNEVEKHKPKVYIPGVFLKLAVEVVRTAMGSQQLDKGSVISINAVMIGRSLALRQGRSVITFDDIRDGVCKALVGNAILKDRPDVEKVVKDFLSEISFYVEKNIKGINISKAVSCFQELKGKDASRTENNIKILITASKTNRELKKLSRWIYENESIHKYRIYEVMAEYLEAYERGGGGDPSVSENL